MLGLRRGDDFVRRPIFSDSFDHIWRISKCGPTQSLETEGVEHSQEKLKSFRDATQTSKIQERASTEVRHTTAEKHKQVLIQVVVYECITSGEPQISRDEEYAFKHQLLMSVY